MPHERAIHACPLLPGVQQSSGANLEVPQNNFQGPLKGTSRNSLLVASWFKDAMFYVLVSSRASPLQAGEDSPELHDTPHPTFSKQMGARILERNTMTHKTYTRRPLRPLFTSLLQCVFRRMYTWASPKTVDPVHAGGAQGIRIQGGSF